MSKYVLVHGGSVTGAIWNDLAALLKQHRHKVYTPTLSDEKHSSLTNHISEVCALIEKKKLDDVLLVGHSYGGLVIAGVGDKMPKKLKREIYLDTCLPTNGESLFGLFKKYGLDPEGFEGLDPFPPYVEPLRFDEERFRAMPKTYVHCKRSEFLAATIHVRNAILQRLAEDNWEYFEIDSMHTCMVDKPQETSEILLRYAD